MNDLVDLYALAGVKKVDLLEVDKKTEPEPACDDETSGSQPCQTKGPGHIYLDIVPAGESTVRLTMTTSSPAA